jgi:hypothetical protein
MDRGSAAIACTGGSAALVLQCASLMVDYWSSAAIKPLVLTGNIAQQTLHRLAETGAWWIELHRPGGLRADQAGYKTTVHVRLIHAFVRRMALGSGVWDSAAWGVPINQGDLFFQIVGFSKLMIDSLERMGHDFTAVEKEGYYAFWRHVAALLGVDGTMPAEVLLSRFTAGPDELRAFVGAGPILTDDQPRVEYFLSLPEDDPPIDLSPLTGDARRYLRK